MVGQNRMQTADDVRHVLEVPSVTCLDMQKNRIAGGEELLQVLEQMPDLRVLYLQGNPVVKEIPHYRKTVVSRLKHLRYLDDRPVFDEERLRCEAWARAFEEGGARAGADAEKAEIRRQREEKQRRDEENFQGTPPLLPSLGPQARPELTCTPALYCPSV